MTIRRRCTERNCKNGRRCLEHLRFDVMRRGKRYRMPVNDFAIPRMEPSKQRPIQSMEEARDWERRFIGEIKAGHDPLRLPSRSVPASTALDNVSAFLDAYWERCVKPAGPRSIASIRGQITVLKEHLGQLPLAAIEDSDEINRFKTESEYAEDVEVASVHRVLERLRAAINWGLAQTPPLFARSPFHRFGVRLNKKAETVRDRRVSREEEKRLLDTALREMSTAPHQYVGEILHDRIIGALELCCRRGEMLLIQNKRVNWDTCQIGIPGSTAKDKENRRIPFNPKGRLAAILKRRATLGPDAFVFGSPTGSLPADNSDSLGNSEATCERPRAEARKGGSGMEPPATATNRSAMARLEARRRLSPVGRRRRYRDHPTDARSREHSADAALPERDGRRTAKRIGGELDQPGPAATSGLRKLNRSRFSAGLSPDCPRKVEKMAPQAGLEPATLRLTVAAGRSCTRWYRASWSRKYRLGFAFHARRDFESNHTNFHSEGAQIWAQALGVNPADRRPTNFCGVHP
jgi:integrase